jgi:YVTN family beta-propeller protein
VAASNRPWAPIAMASLFCLGLTLRALMTGLGVASDGNRATVHRGRAGERHLRQSQHLGQRPRRGEAGHGEAVSHERDRLYVATNDGIEVIGVDDTLEAIETTPWDVDGRTGGRAFYVRLSTDGNSLVTYLANRAPNQPWGEWENDAYLLDLDTNEATRIPLANGYVWRMGISDSHAAYFNLTPDGDPDGDQVHLLDLDADSATFGTIVASVALPELSNRATGDTEIWMQPDAEYRRITMTPDGQYVYVTNGGDGTISVIDTEERAIVATIDAPSALVGGGSVTTAQSGFELVDTVAR